MTVPISQTSAKRDISRLQNREARLRVRRYPVQLKSMAIFAVVFYLFVFIQMVVAAPPNGACDLPQDLQREIVSKYPGTKLVTLSDLSEDDRGVFQKDHGDSCPGLVKVDFYGDGKPTWALALIAKDGAKERAELVLAHQIGEHWRTTLLEKASTVPVVWSQPPGGYQDVYGQKKIQATRPVIVFCGYESWAILYAWTGKDFTKIWIAD